MKRSTLQAVPPRLRPSVCQFCQFSVYSLPRRHPIRRQQLALTRSTGGLQNSNREWQKRLPNITRQQNGLNRLASSTATQQAGGSPESVLEDVTQQSRAIITAETLPHEQSVLSLLQRCREIVDVAISDKRNTETEEHNTDDNAASSLLDLEGQNSRSRSSAGAASTKESFCAKARSSISSILNELIQDPKIFISPEILNRYTDIQCRLSNVDYIPEVFSLYANKDAPYTSGSTIKYRRSSPKSAKNAIPKELADRALDIAVAQKNLPLALAIVDKSFCAPAFRRAKIIRKTAVPIAGAMATPPAAYISASYLSTLQVTMDTSTATWIAFSAIMAYVAFTSTIGLVAITTSNDQMERVVWLPGTQLRQRWVREEERAAMDKIAMAWGFKDPLMRGVEQGEDWENLREILGMRGMVLDKTDLMEGME